MDLENVVGGALDWKKYTYIGAGCVAVVLALSIVLIVVLKKKKKATEHSRQETLQDWETITRWYRNEQGEIMISI